MDYLYYFSLKWLLFLIFHYNLKVFNFNIMTDTTVVSMGAIVVFCMLLTYLFVGTCIEGYKCSFGHEASFTILLGILISFGTYEYNEKLI